MSYISGHRLPWKRFWTPWDGRIRCGFDGRGFLDDPEGEWGKYTNTQVRSLDALLLKRCVVLWGQPGTGKTITIEEAIEKLTASTRPPDVLFSFHCRDITGIEMLKAETVGHSRWQASRAANGNITLILDGVDEGLRKVPEFVRALAVTLKSEPSNHLRLVLLCRSAEWDTAAGENLMRLWPEDDRAGVYELCPLRQTDVEAAAKATGVDVKAFMQAVYRTRVQGLAARPITLNMLLEEFLSKNELPKNRRTLYTQAALRLCAEIDEDRIKALRKHYKPPPEKHVYRVVCRIAALLMLCAKSAVLKGGNRKPAANELPWRDITGGTEVVDGEVFDVTPELVESALETAHFSVRGPYLLGFDHPTFAELLAAEYLQELPLIQLSQLLCQRVGGRMLIVPQLAEVAAWLATDRQDWTQFLIEHHPETLLRTDVSTISNTLKERAVASLLKRADSDGALDDRVSDYYSALRHPRLADQLRPYLRDRTWNWAVRRFAIELVGDAGIKELESDLWDLLKTPDVAHNAITHSLADLAGPHSRKHLIKAMRGQFPGDSQRDLLGVALRRIIPRILPVRKTIPYLNVASPSGYSGSYSAVRFSHVPKHIKVADLPSLLVAMKKWDGCFDVGSSLRHISQRTFALALQNLHKPRIAELTVKMWLTKSRRYNWLPGRNNDQDTFNAVGLNDDRRRTQFVRVMLKSVETNAGDLLQYDSPLLTQADAGWLLEELPTSPKNCREKWAKVAAALLWRADRTKHRELLLRTYQLVPELRKYLPSPKKGDIFITLDRYQCAGRLRTERNQKRWQKKRQTPSRRQLLDSAFLVLRTINSTGWVGISRCAYVEDPDDPKPRKVDTSSYYGITTSPGWNQLSELERQEAMSGARSFLLDCNDKQSDPAHYSNYAEAAYHAIRLWRDRLQMDRALRRAIKKKWLFAITDRANNGEKEHRDQVALAYKLSPVVVTRRLLVQLFADDMRDGFALPLRPFEGCWNRHLSQAVSAFLLKQQLKPRSVKSILEHLVLCDRPSAAKALDTLLHCHLKKPSLADIKGALISAALFSLPDEFWERYWVVLVSAPRMQIKRFFLEHAFHLTRSELKVFERLTESQVGDLYLLLVKIFPSSSDPQDALGETHSMTERHQMRDLRQGMLNILASRATEASLSELQHLIKSAPARERQGLQWYHMEAVKALLRKLWSADVPRTEEVLFMARSHQARRVEDEESLTEAVLESLERLQSELRTNGLLSVRELWNEPKRPLPATPKREETLSDLISRWLKRDLPAKTGIIVNCEVKVERFGNGRLDIKIEAIVRGGPSSRRIAVIIEVKRCDHRHVHTACRTQLVEGYLKPQGLTHGIYLVGWFGSKKGPAAQWKTPEQAGTCVSNWVKSASDSGVAPTGFVLDCRLPNLPAPSRRRPASCSNSMHRLPTP